MFARMKFFLQAPSFDDPEKDIQAQNLNLFLRVLFILTVLFLIYSIFTPPYIQILIACFALVFELGLFFLLKSRQLRIVGVLVTSFLWLAILTEVVLVRGIRDSGFASFVLVIAIAGLTMGARTSLFYTFLTLVAGAFLAFIESQGILPPHQNPSIWMVLLSYGITFTGSALLINLVIHLKVNVTPLYKCIIMLHSDGIIYIDVFLYVNRGSFYIDVCNIHTVRPIISPAVVCFTRCKRHPCHVCRCVHPPDITRTPIDFSSPWRHPEPSYRNRIRPPAIMIRGPAPRLI
jgi:hypothetical protein